MPAGYSATVKTALAQPTFRPRLLVSVEGAFNWWDERGRDLPWDSRTWRSAAPILAVSNQQEDYSPGSRNVQIEISALDPDIRAIGAGEHFLARVQVYRAFLDSALELIPDPLLVHEERVDYMVLRRGPSPRLIINSENIAILMAQSAPKLRTHQDHIVEFPGDNFYKHTAKLVDNPVHVLVGYRPPLSL